MKKWIVTAVGHGETCDGKARVLAVCDTKEEAANYIRNDMEDYLDNNVDEGLVADFDRWSVGYKYQSFDTACEWNAEEVEIPLKSA